MRTAYGYILGFNFFIFDHGLIITCKKYFFKKTNPRFEKPLTLEATVCDITDSCHKREPFGVLFRVPKL